MVKSALSLRYQYGFTLEYIQNSMYMSVGVIEDIYYV